MFPKYDSTKTPLENAKNRITAAYVAGFISAGITLVFILVIASGYNIIQGYDLSALLDVALIVILAFLIMKIKSRIAAVILFAQFVWAKIANFIVNPEASASAGSIIMMIIFLVAFFNGIRGTFAYQKIMKEERAKTQD